MTTTAIQLQRCESRQQVEKIAERNRIPLGADFHTNAYAASVRFRGVTYFWAAA